MCIIVKQTRKSYPLVAPDVVKVITIANNNNTLNAQMLGINLNQDRIEK